MNHRPVLVAYAVNGEGQCLAEASTNTRSRRVLKALVKRVIRNAGLSGAGLSVGVFAKDRHTTRTPNPPCVGKRGKA